MNRLGPPMNPAAMSVSNECESPLSTVAAQIVRMASTEDVASSDLGAMAESDPGFAMRLLALVNSPAFGATVKIGDVRRAASQLGVRGMRNLALSLVLSDMVPVGRDAEVLLTNAVRRAVTSRHLAGLLGRSETDTYYTAGLLLDAGILVWARHALVDAIDVARTPACHRQLKERALGRYAHSESGSELAYTFSLPEDTVEAIRRHHDPEPPAQDLARVAWVAERVAAVFEGGVPDRNRSEAMKALSALPIDPSTRDQVFRAMPKLTAEAGKALDRSFSEQLDLEALSADVNRCLIELNAHYESAIRRLEAVVAEKDALAEELRQANAQLQELALVDGLTNLPNRRAFDRSLEEALSRSERDGLPVSLLMLDIDHFKKVNDEHGHRAGDDVLRSFAQIVRASLRGGDVAARYGGEEFAVILPNTDAETSRDVATRLRICVQGARMHTCSGFLRVTVSCGAAAVCGPGSRAQLESLIERADQALYAAKRGGRNQVAVAPELVAAAG